MTDRRTYDASWRLSVNWRSFVGKGCWLQKGMGEVGLVAGLAEFMGYCCPEKGNKETTITGKLVAINFYHEQFVGLSLPLGSPLIKSVKQGIKRARIEKGTQLRVRKPLTWGILRTDENAGERPILWGGGKGGMDRLGVVLFLDVTGIC